MQDVAKFREAEFVGSSQSLVVLVAMCLPGEFVPTVPGVACLSINSGCLAPNVWLKSLNLNYCCANLAT